MIGWAKFTRLIEIELMCLSKSGRAIAPLPSISYSPASRSLYSIFPLEIVKNLPHNFYGFKSVYYFQTFLLFHGDFFQFQFGFRTRRTDNMIVSRIFIAAAIILPYVLSFPLENDLSVSVKYLEQLENRIHNLEAPGM